MSRDSLFLVLCCSLGLACTKPADAPAAAAKDEAATKPDPDGEPVAEVRGDSRFWVVHGGLHTYDLDGNKLSSLGDRGDRALRLADGRVVVIDESETGMHLSVLDDKGKPGVEVDLPTIFDDQKCKMSMAKPAKDGEGDEYGEYPELSMQSERDFSLNGAGTHACVSLLDRNENMADYSIDLAVDLATGKVATAVDYALGEHCPAGSLAACKDSASVEPWAEHSAAIEAKSWPHAYDTKTGMLSRAGKPVRELCVPKAERDEDWDPTYGGCLAVEQTSDNGRWLLVTADNDIGGDYLYRIVYLLDLETGKLSSIECEDEAPCTMMAIAPEQLFAGDEPPGYSIVSETEVGSLPGDRFWVDGMLLIPEAGKVVQIGGTRVLTMTK